ncbi:MAG TPA: glucose-6-phosphate dehydrogenase assembly protein OpcA [Solirubrobacteraceae bacterium]|nr:glucose-6-phosphate dehydrogenase assembly protein OpcA [Solirubrobacteraceae bacterium]
MLTRSSQGTESLGDAVWSAEGTTPDAIEAALRELVKRRHAENGGLVPARALNMIAFVESGYAGEIANRLAGVGRYHASRLIVLSYDPGRLRLDARAVVSTDSEPAAGEIGLMRETVTVEIGARHLDDLVTIVDPLVVTDLATLVWSPHGHPEAVDELLALAQAVLIDSVDEPSWREAVARACELRGRAYVVDLAWLRSIPWRERVAAAFDSPAMRAELREIESVSVRYHPDSTVAALLLVSWLGSRLGWEMSRLRPAGGGLAGSARSGSAHGAGTGGTGSRSTDAGSTGDGSTGGEREIAIHLEPAPEQEVRGLESVAIATASGRRVGLRRGAGGLRSRRRDPDGHEHEWTILGASRGESGILGEGIRQSLLRDPTYGPALQGAETMTP